METKTTEIYNDERCNSVAYFLWAITGFLGLQNMYVGRNKLALAEFALFVTIECIISTNTDLTRIIASTDSSRLMTVYDFLYTTFLADYIHNFIVQWFVGAYLFAPIPLAILGALWIYDLFTLNQAVLNFNNRLEESKTSMA